MKRYEIFRKKVFDTLSVSPTDSKISKAIDIFLLALIFLNSVVVVLESVQRIFLLRPLWFLIFDIFSIVIFTIEYILRVLSCTASPRYRLPIKGRIRYMITPFALIDFFAIAPFYIPFLFAIDLRFLRALRLFRSFRILKLGRYTKALYELGAIIRAKKEELILAIFMVFTLLLFSASLMYFVENPVQPHAFSSIPASLWWAAITLTTVGYGDIYPITTIGKIIGSIFAILGIGLFALPAGIIASGFLEQVRNNKKGTKCPYCGKNFLS